MAKLSGPMSDALSDLASYGVFQDGTRKQTITGLISRGLVIKTGDDDYNVTDDGYAELGTTKPVTLTAEISLPNDTPDHRKFHIESGMPLRLYGACATCNGDNAPLADWEAELLGINPDRPYVVQQYRNGIWYNVPGMEYRTWGTASVKRYQREHIYSDAICRVFDSIENRICA